MNKREIKGLKVEGLEVKNKSKGKITDTVLIDLAHFSVEVNKAVDEICKAADPIKYKQFNGNHCIQTAACVKYILDKYFVADGISNNSIVSSIYLGIMKDNVSNDAYYNHAYNVIYDKKDDISYLIDVSRDKQERPSLIACVTGFCNCYDDSQVNGISFKGYQDIKIRELTELDWGLIESSECEFFTMKPSVELFSKVEELCKDKIKEFIGETKDE